MIEVAIKAVEEVFDWKEYLRENFWSGCKMTLKEAYEYGRERLNAAGIEECSVDAWYLLELSSWLDSEQAYFFVMSERRSRMSSALYIKPIWSRGRSIFHFSISQVFRKFMGLEFAVNEHVLVPRQDTETLVECVLSYVQPQMKVLDMCTGSGCILISLEHYRKGIRAVGADISDEALQVAKRNAESLNADVTFLKSDLFEQVAERYDLIVSNPPYIRTKAIEELEEEVRLHDPMIALDGKEDGLYFYRKITEKSREHLKQVVGSSFETRVMIKERMLRR